MRTTLFTMLALFIAGLSANAQNLLKGTVRETGSESRLNNVFLRDINNNQMTLADKDGNFAIRTAPGHTLIFNSPGYVNDTLYVVDMAPKKVRMAVLTIALRQVNISSKSARFNPQAEYPEVYEKSKVYVLSPSSWFGKDSRDARRLKRYFAIEQQEQQIDAVFNTSYVGSIVPLKGQELEDFMTMYRPSYAFVKSNTGPSMASYINDSYKKYMALPADKRKLQKLSGE